MIGIVSFGVYVPFYRFNKEGFFDALGWYKPSLASFSRGELAFANYDEDSITMSVEASLGALKSYDRKRIDALYFATASPPYNEPSNASIIATAIDLRSGVLSVDITGSLKSLTSSVGIVRNSLMNSSQWDSVLICGADIRVAKPANPLEAVFGDAAVSFVLGRDNYVVEIEDIYHISKSFLDYRKVWSDKYVKSWEDRWIRDEGYTKTVVEVVNGLLERTDLNISDFYKVIYPSMDRKTAVSIARKLNLHEGQLEDILIDIIGFTSNTHVFLMFANAVKQANPGDRILLIGYGSGADAIVFKVMPEIEEKRSMFDIDIMLSNKKVVDNYTKFAVLKDKISVEKGPRGEVAKAAMSVLWRDRKAILGLYGSVCKKCGTKVYPAQHVCVNPECRAIDQMRDYRFAEDKGKIFTYTVDNLAFSISPPAIYGLVDFDKGGRYWFDITDCDQKDIKVNMPVRMSFRRKFFDEQRGLYGYFWKATPRIF